MTAVFQDPIFQDENVAREALEAVAAARADPIVIGDARGEVRRARTAPAAVVLQPAVHPVRLPQVHRNVVPLAHGQRWDVDPSLPAVVRHAEATIISLENVPRIARIDPDHAIVAVQRLVRTVECLAAII